MNRQGGKRIVETAGIGKYSHSAQKAVAYQECEKHPARAFPAQPRICKKHIHGDAAQLKREIPPVVCPVPENKCEKTLLPYLAAQHEHAAQEKILSDSPGKYVSINEDRPVISAPL